MKAVIQRAKKAAVHVDNTEIARISAGLLILLGVLKGDDEAHSTVLAKKCADLRIFEDDQGKMNLSVKDASGEIMVVSQFTLGANCKKGRRPSFDMAADPKMGEELYNHFCQEIKNQGIPVKTGKFAAHMDVSLTNNGPVTIIIDSNELL